MNNKISIFCSALKDFQSIIGEDIDESIKEYDTTTQLSIKTSMLETFKLIAEVYEVTETTDATKFVRACETAVRRGSSITNTDSENLASLKNKFTSITLSHLPQFVLHHDLVATPPKPTILK